MKHTMRAVIGGAGFAALMLVGLDAAAQSAAPAPGYPPGYSQGYPPSYPAPVQPSYPAPVQPSYPAPAQPSYPAPVQPSYPAPAQPSYPAPAQQPSYPSQTPAYQQAPVYQQAPGQGYPPAATAPAPGYPAYPAPGYPAPAPGYPPPGYGALAAPAAPLQWYQTGYAHIGGVLGFHGWGSSHVSGHDSTIKGEFLGGVNLSGYYVSSPSVHVGGYLRYSSGKMGGDSDQFSIGFSLKAGNRVAERAWLGFVGDLGLYVLDFSGTSAWYGVELSPRIHLDVLGFDAGGLKMGFFASFGPSVVPYVAGSYKVPSYYGSSSSVDIRAYIIYLTMQLGVTFGS